MIKAGEIPFLPGCFGVTVVTEIYKYIIIIIIIIIIVLIIIIIIHCTLFHL